MKMASLMAADTPNNRGPSPTNLDKEFRKKKRLENTACLSTEKHNLKKLQDISRHILGCVKIGDRVEVLTGSDKNGLKGIWDQAIELDGKENTPLLWTESVESSIDTENKEMSEEKSQSREQKKKFMQYVTALGLEGELKRIRAIREDDRVGPGTLVKNVELSLKVWRDLKNKEHVNNIESVKKWRKDNGLKQEMDGDAEKRAKQSYDQFTTALRDIIDDYQKNTVYMDTKSKRTVLETAITGESNEVITSPPANTKSSSTKPVPGLTRDSSSPSPRVDPYSLERDVKAQIIQLTPMRHDLEVELNGLMKPFSEESKERFHNEVYKGQFPDQVISIKRLLDGEFTRIGEAENSNDSKHRPKNRGQDPENSETMNGMALRVGTTNSRIEKGRKDMSEKVKKEKETSKDKKQPEPKTRDTESPEQRIRYFHIPYNNMEVGR
jgi:hypothetical protein